MKGLDSSTETARCHLSNVINFRENRSLLFQAFSTRRDTLGKGVDGDAVFRAVFQFWAHQVFNSGKAQCAIRVQDLKKWDLVSGAKDLQTTIDEAIAGSVPF